MPLWNRHKIKGPVEFDILSAIWILACTDQDAIITYKGIVNRLATEGLTEDDVRKLVKNRGELFSPIISSQWFSEWKTWVIDHGHYPSWVTERFPDKTYRDAAVNDIEKHDVFRSQFRTYDKQKPCGITRISWGIEHLDRLRKANVEAREQRLATWGSLVSVIIPVITILGTFYVTSQTLESTRQLNKETNDVTLKANENTTALARQVATADTRLKIWDLLAKERGDSFALSMNAMEDAFYAARRHDHRQLTSSLKAIRLSYYRFEQEIETPDTRAEVWKRYADFAEFCEALADTKGKAAMSKDWTAKFQEQKKLSHDLLYNTIFVRTREEEDNLKLILDRKPSSP